MSIMEMVEKAKVKFRWFRTVETSSTDSIKLQAKKSQCLELVELVWDKEKRFYESPLTDVECGLYSSPNLYIGDKDYPCKSFTVVPDTFEVHIFLVKESLDESLSKLDFSLNPLIIINQSLSPVENHDYLESQNSVPKSVTAVHCDVYEQILISKNQEIRNLQNELKQLRLSILDIYSNNVNKTSVSCSSEDLGGSKKDETFEDGRNTTIPNISSSEVLPGLLDELRATRDELRATCEKNEQLNKDVLTLQQENSKLLKLLDARKPIVKSSTIDNLNFSENDSESTQYQPLPSTIYTSSSLPILSDRDVEMSVPRRFASFNDTEYTPPSPDLNERHCKVGSGAQTDITAIDNPPKLYRKSKSSVKKNNSRRQHQNRGKSSGHENDSSSDTEQILQEAETFVTNTLRNYSVVNYSLQENDLVSPAVSTIHQQTAEDEVQLSTSYSVLKNRTRLRPFLPRSVNDLRAGNVIRYFAASGRIEKGKVAYLSSVPGEMNLAIVTEALDSEIHQLSSSPRRTFVSFKKVILAWEEWNSSCEPNL